MSSRIAAVSASTFYAKQRNAFSLVEAATATRDIPERIARLEEARAAYTDLLDAHRALPPRLARKLDAAMGTVAGMVTSIDASLDAHRKLDGWQAKAQA